MPEDSSSTRRKGAGIPPLLGEEKCLGLSQGGVVILILVYNVSMNWFFIALAAPFLWALVNISDKYLVANFSSGKERSSGALVLFSSLIGLLVASIIFFFTPGISGISLLDKILLIFIGALSVIGVIFYLFALEMEEASAVVSWMLIIPVFGYLLGYGIMGEMLTKKQLLGMFIVLIGSAILSLDFNQIKIIFKRKIMTYMILSGIVYAINGVIFKFVTFDGSFWISSFWEYLGLGITGILILFFIKPYRQNFTSMMKKGGLFIFSVNLVSEITTILGNLLTKYALLIAPVALVYLVSAFQPLAVLLLTFFSTKFFPKIVTENFSKKIIIPKLIAITIMILGSVILFI